VVFVLDSVYVFIIFIDLYILSHLCIPGMKPTWPCCMIFLMCCWIRFASILENF
jgi:hypothetical protein